MNREPSLGYQNTTGLSLHAMSRPKMPPRDSLYKERRSSGSTVSSDAIRSLADDFSVRSEELQGRGMMVDFLLEFADDFVDLSNLVGKEGTRRISQIPVKKDGSDSSSYKARKRGLPERKMYPSPISVASIPDLDGASLMIKARILQESRSLRNQRPSRHPSFQRSLSGRRIGSPASAVHPHSDEINSYANSSTPGYQSVARRPSLCPSQSSNSTTPSFGGSQHHYYTNRYGASHESSQAHMHYQQQYNQHPSQRHYEPDRSQYQDQYYAQHQYPQHQSYNGGHHSSAGVDTLRSSGHSLEGNSYHKKTSHNSSNHHQQEHQPAKAAMQIEVTRGVFAPLRGSEETWRAIESGQVVRTDCPCCTSSLLCIEDAEYVLCPECRVISPVTSDWKFPSARMSRGVGLGYRAERSAR